MPTSLKIMRKKTILQISLLILLIFFTFLIFIFYYEENVSENLILTDKMNNLDKNDKINSQENLIEDIRYTTKNLRGDVYEILADTGETNKENPEILFLKNVKGNIKFISKNKENVQLKSNFANFNTKTFETTFIIDVKVSRKDEIITGDKLYLVFDLESESNGESLNKEQNILRMSDNVLFQKPGYTLKADILEIDMVTKNLKIYMNNETQKVTGKTTLK